MHATIRQCLFFSILSLFARLSVASPIVSASEIINVELWHKSIGSTTIDAILEDTSVFVKASDIFSFIKVKTTASSDHKILYGWYEDESKHFTIDFAKKHISYNGNEYPLRISDVIEERKECYLRSSLFGSIFKLFCEFNFNSLSLEVRSEIKLPAEIEAENSKKRTYLSAQAAPIQPERSFGLSRSFFSFGTLDWAAGGSYSESSKASSYSFLTGGQFLGGDFDVLFYGSDRQNIDWKNSPWQWRTAFDSKILSQVIVGRRTTFSNLHLADSMVGAQISNAPLEYRTSFTNYQISDHTEPDWIVELYINDVLINYTKADQTGFYQFIIQLPYGTTDVKLKFNGPYGEVRSKIMQLNIPYTFLPPGSVEYTLTAGAPASLLAMNRSVGKADLKAGISSRLTIGGGLRYYHDYSGMSQNEPYATTSLQPIQGVLLSGEYRYRSGIRSNLNILAPLGITIDATYDHSFRPYSLVYDEFSIIDQRKLQILAPIPFLSGMVRFSGVDLPFSGDTSLLTSTFEVYASVFNLAWNFSATAVSYRHNAELFTKQLLASSGVSINIMQGYLLRPSVTVDCQSWKPLISELMLTHYFPNMSTLSVTARHTFADNTNTIQADFRMTLPFMQFGAISSVSNTGPVQLNGTMQGSVSFDPESERLIADYQPSVRQGGVLICPFLDRNNNGKRENDEPIVKHFGIEQAPGKVISQEDGMLRIVGLEPYRTYLIKTSMTEIENISWTPKFKTFEITPPANGFAKIEIPVTIAGQVEGYVFLNSATTADALGGIRLMIHHNDPDDSSEVKPAEDLLTYSNGEYYYLGLTPGKYHVMVDSSQLQLLHYTSTPAYRDIEIKSVEEGDMVEKINFILKEDIGPGMPVRH
jgi:hypothetical protein